MKKITNKIFWATAVAVILIIVLGITISLQIFYRQNPPLPRQDQDSYQQFDFSDTDTLETITEIEEVSNL